MINFFIIIGVTGCILLMICIYGLIRNEWVFNQRSKLWGTEDYWSLPSYYEMLEVKWWKWNINKF